MTGVQTCALPIFDKHKDYNLVRKDIAAIKVLMPDVLHDIAWRAMQVHGALGVSNEMPFSGMVLAASVLGLADGPTEVHQVQVANALLKTAMPAPGLFPTEHIPTKTEAARAKYRSLL